jgi:hypothetical protein
LFLALVTLGLLCACVVPVRNSYPAAERAAAEGQLLRALAHLSQMGPAHPRYTEARALAEQVETRMRTAQVLLLEGLRLRAEGRQLEALAILASARDAWPDMVGLAEWLASTEASVQASAVIAGQAVSAWERPVLVDAPSLPEAATSAVAALPALTLEETPAPDSPPATIGSGSVEAAATPAPAGDCPPILSSERSNPLAADLSRRRLMAIQEQLDRGALQEAVDQLEAMIAEAPDDDSTARMLSRLLMQRGMLRYGRGSLELAIADWTRVRQLAGDSAATERMLRQAELELVIR